jgi:hypothetical protein
MLDGANWKSGDIGDEVRNVPLNINQITFICAGLRDLAAAANDRIGRSISDDYEADTRVRDENTEIADYLESLI